jgi:predicted phosphate transport protein (TIGR00153 family)
MMNWFQAIMPKEERFFELFRRHADTLVKGAEALRAVLEGGANVEANCRLVMEYEQEADDVTREVMTLIRRTLVTPFDRGDIKELISSLDDAIDQMRKTTKAIILYEVTRFDPPMRELGDQIVHAAKLTVEAVGLLNAMIKNAPRLNVLAEDIARLEEASDETHEAGMKALYRGHGKKDPMAFIIGSEIYDHLEKVVDRFEDVAHRISGIIIEHS